MAGEQGKGNRHSPGLSNDSHKKKQLNKTRKLLHACSRSFTQWSGVGSSQTLAHLNLERFCLMYLPYPADLLFPCLLFTPLLTPLAMRPPGSSPQAPGAHPRAPRPPRARPQALRGWPRGLPLRPPRGWLRPRRRPRRQGWCPRRLPAPVRRLRPRWCPPVNLPCMLPALLVLAAGVCNPPAVSLP